MIDGTVQLVPVPLISLVSRGLKVMQRFVPSFLINSTLTMLPPQLKIKLLIALVLEIEERVMVWRGRIVKVFVEAHEIIVISLNNGTKFSRSHKRSLSV